MNFNNSIEGKKSEAKSCSELLLEFKRKEKEEEVRPKGVKLKFLGIGSKDVYNITPPFSIDGMKVIAGRVETREDEFNSEVHFFERLDEDTWVKIDNALVFNLQDPFVTTVGGEIIVGGVEVEVSRPPLDDKDDSITYTHRTAFYKGKSLSDLKRFSVGPEKMKDIRIIELENGHIGVFTRPQEGIYGQGKIGYIELNGLGDLTSENISKAKIIENLFVSSEWGGANQLRLLKNGTIGVIGHIACFDEKYNKLYYGMSFVFDPFKHTASPLKIIATRDNFPVGASKRPELEKVIFLGGINEGGIDKKFDLYAGLGDAESGVTTIDYPFDYPF